MDAVLDTVASARRPRRTGAATRTDLAGVRTRVARLEAQPDVLQWLAGLNALASPAMAARLFGAI